MEDSNDIVLKNWVLYKKETSYKKILIKKYCAVMLLRKTDEIGYLQGVILYFPSNERIGFIYSYCALMNDRLSENEHSIYNY